jgi:hypothetical protein
MFLAANIVESSGNFCVNTPLLPANQNSYADADVQPGQTYCYAVTYLHSDSCTTSESPVSNIACGQICTNACPQPEILITGNNWASGDQGSPPIQTYDFTDGSLVHSLTPAGAPYASGRGLAIYDGDIYYTELLAAGSGGSDVIHFCYYGTEGSGSATDTGTFQNPDPRRDVFGNPAGIQDLAFHYDSNLQKTELYALTGYPNLPPEVFEIDSDPTSQTYGKTLAGPFPLTGQADDGGHAAEDSDGFTVLPNGHFLVNEGDGSPVYDEYQIEGTHAVLIPQSSGGLRIDLRNYAGNGVNFSHGTGVATSPDGQSLYFIADSTITAAPTLLQIRLSDSSLINSKQINNPNYPDNSIEDIDVVILQ